MIALEDALAEVLASCHPGRVVTVPVKEALGLVLAQAVSTSEPVPPFDNTAMDGYAVRASDVAGASEGSPARLRVIGTLAAGGVPVAPVREGEALRIMTGAIFPRGADAVAIVETTRSDGDTVEILAPATAGEHIRHAGDDLMAGSEVLAPGTVLGPGHLGVLSSVGCQTVAVVEAPVVGVLSTGDELVDGSGPLEPGQIRDSNRMTLLSLLRRDGFVGRDLGIVADSEEAIQSALENGAAGCHAVLTSGGVSMGDFDYVKSVLDRIGRMHWMQVAIRPAKPFAFGTVGDTPVFGLPGNPVSSMVSYEVLARPALRLMAGMSMDAVNRPRVSAAVEGGGWKAARDGRTSFVRTLIRVDAEGRLWVRSAGGQGSHQLSAMAAADALAVTPPEIDAKDGDIVRVMLL